MQKTALITGASSGIGEAIAYEYASKKMHLLLIARNIERLARVADACRDLGAAAVEIASIDVTDKRSMDAWISAMDDKYAIDTVVVNAGLVASVTNANYLAASLETVNTNIIGAINTIQPCIAPMQSRGHGNIIMISSVAGIVALPNLFEKAIAAYCMSKRFMRIYGEGIRCLYSSAGIRVNVICPGVVNTKLIQQIPEVAKYNRSSLAANDVVHALRSATLYNTPVTIAPVWKSVFYSVIAPIIPFSIYAGLLTWLIEKRYPNELKYSFRYKVPTNQKPQNILITGASSGLGAALAREYASHGVNLALVGRDKDRLNTVSSACKNKGAGVYTYTVDISDTNRMSKCIEACEDNMALDLVVANAGVSGGVSTHTMEDGDQIMEIIKTNINGTLNTIEPVIRKMKERRRGQIIIIASFLALRGIPGQPTYCATKAALLSYGESLIMELSGYNISVSIACCGYIKTPMSEGNPLRVFAVEPEDCARAIRIAAARNVYIITYPFYMSLVTQFLNVALPKRISDWIVSRFFPRRKPMSRYDI